MGNLFCGKRLRSCIFLGHGTTCTTRFNNHASVCSENACQSILVQRTCSFSCLVMTCPLPPLPLSPVKAKNRVSVTYDLFLLNVHIHKHAHTNVLTHTYTHIETLPLEIQFSVKSSTLCGSMLHRVEEQKKLKSQLKQ